MNCSHVHNHMCVAYALMHLAASCSSGHAQASKKAARRRSFRPAMTGFESQSSMRCWWSRLATLSDVGWAATRSVEMARDGAVPLATVPVSTVRSHQAAPTVTRKSGRAYTYVVKCSRLGRGRTVLGLASMRNSTSV